MRHISNALYLLVVCVILHATATAEPSGAAAALNIQAIPSTPTIENSDATVTMPDGSSKNLKAPHTSVQLKIKNKSEDESVNIDLIVFYIKLPFADQEMYQFKLAEPFKIGPGESKTTDSFFLDKLPESNNKKVYVSVSITGWKNTGSDPGDEFSTGGGFSLQ